MKKLLTLVMATFLLSGMTLMADAKGEGEGKKGEGKKGEKGKKGGPSAERRAAMHEKMKNMTEEERKAFIAEMRAKHGEKGEGRKGKKGKKGKEKKAE